MFVSSPPALPTPGHETVGGCPGESRDLSIRRSCHRKVDPSFRWGSIQYYPSSRIALFLSRAILLSLLLLLVIAGSGRAEPSEAERAARWSDLRHAIFGDRIVEDAGDLVAIDAPARAEDAAIVPVGIHVGEPLAPQIRSLYLVIDD